MMRTSTFPGICQAGNAREVTIPDCGPDAEAHHHFDASRRLAFGLTATCWWPGPTVTDSGCPALVPSSTTETVLVSGPGRLRSFPLIAVPDPVLGHGLLSRCERAPSPTPAGLSRLEFQIENSQADPALDDSRLDAIKSTRVTSNPNVPPTSTLLARATTVFHYSFVWYRGHFTATGSEDVRQRHGASKVRVSTSMGRCWAAGLDRSKDPPHAYAAMQNL